MKIAIYPGSFNPWHAGHQNVLDQALRVFDKVIIAIGINPEKNVLQNNILTDGENREIALRKNFKQTKKIEVVHFTELLSEFINKNDENIDCIIKGIRNAQDLEYETAQQYWNEDLGVTIPTFYVICDRNLRHISSSAIKQVERIKNYE